MKRPNAPNGETLPGFEQSQFFQFLLTLLSVKMKVKFPCKMTLQQASHTITAQVSPNEEGRFIFNQELRLREQREKLFTQLNMCLITEKGARYITGTAKLYHNQLLRSEGERIVVTLSKCLDADSFCQLRVDKVIREGSARFRTLTNIPEKSKRYLSPPLNEQLSQSPADFKIPRKNQPVHIGFQSKSQSHIPVIGSLRIGRREQNLGVREYAAVARYGNSHRESHPSPKGRSKRSYSKNKLQSLQYADFQRQKYLQGQVYRESYQNLKQKYLKQVQNSKNQLKKRIMLENNENNYKLQIVRLKLKLEDLQKSQTGKNLKLNELTLTLSSFQGLQSELHLLREELANKQHAINIMDDTIITLSKENDELRLASKENMHKLQEKMLLLENELQMIDSKNKAQKEEIQREIRKVRQTLQQRQTQIDNRTNMLQQAKKNIYQLQKNIQNKIFEYDSQLQNERTLCKQKSDEHKLKSEEANLSYIKLSLENNHLMSEIDRLKGVLMKNQYQIKLYHHQINSLKTQIEQLKAIRERYNQTVRQFRSLSQQKLMLQRSQEKIMISKQTSIDSALADYKKQIESLKKSNGQLQEKSRLLSTRFIQSDSQLEISRSGLQKLKRNHENTSKELTELKQRQKQLKRSLKSKQQQLQDTRKQLNRLKQKKLSLIENTKKQMIANRDQLSRLKIQLESQAGKNEQLVQTNTQLNMELAKLKIYQKYQGEKYGKLIESAKEKYAQFQIIIKQHEGVIQLFEQKVRAHKENEKDYLSKLQRYDFQVYQALQTNGRLMRDLRTVEENNKQYQNALKVKQGQLMEALQRISEVQKKAEKLQQQGQQLKTQLQFKQNQIEKSKKMIQILQKDYERAKIDIISYCQKLNEHEKKIDDKIMDCKREKENFMTSETKYNHLKKQYQKFKDSVSQALTISFAQLTQKYINQSIKFSNSNETPVFSKKVIANTNTDIVTTIHSVGRQSKSKIQKLIEKTRRLQKDLDLSKKQLQRVRMSSLKQISQKASHIQQLKQSLISLKNEKGEAQAKICLTVQQLESELKYYKSQCVTLISTKEELEFALESLRMQLQKISQDYQRKFFGLQNLKNELQQKLEYQCLNTAIAEKRAHQMQLKLMSLNSVLTHQKEQVYKKQVHLAQSDQQKQSIIQEFQSFRKQLKHSEQRYAELEIQFTATNQIKEKYEKELNEQEKKLKQIRNFNNIIIKEKQEIIKKELLKNEQLIQLQNTIIDLRYTLKQEEGFKSNYKADFEEARESTKRHLSQMKDLQYIIQQEKAKYNAITEKLRQKQHMLIEINLENVNIKAKYQQNLKKVKSVTENLKIQNANLFKQTQAIKIQSQQKISQLQSQLVRANHQINSNKEEISELQQVLFVQRQNNNSMHVSINKLKGQIQDLTKKREEMEKNYEQLIEQNKEKDETMFEMGGKLYEYQSRMREMQDQKLREIQQLTDNLTVKYDQDYQEINQKLELVQKQRNYFKQKFNQKEQDISNKNQQLKQNQIEQMEFRKMFQDKFKKLQEEKFHFAAEKNKELTKALDQNKAHFQAFRAKQTQLRKVSHELQISRNSIQKLEAKMKEMQSQRQTQIKIYEAQIQSLRRSNILFQNYKDTVKSSRWSCQRQLRKQMQNLTKKWLQGGQKQVLNQNLVCAIKSIEQALVSAFQNIGEEIK